MSLFEKDAILFSFLMALQLIESDGTLEKKLIKSFFRKGTWTDAENIFPGTEINSGWLTREKWVQLDELCSKFEILTGFPNKFTQNLIVYDEIFKKETNLNKPFPGLFDNIDKKDKKDKKDTREIKEIFLKLLVIKIFKPEYLTLTIQEFILKYFENNKKFTSRCIFNIRNTYLIMKQSIPMLFIHEKGSDPLIDISKFSKDFNISDENLAKKSVCRGQNDNIDKALCKAREKGQWIVIQNLHLESSF